MQIYYNKAMEDHDALAIQVGEALRRRRLKLITAESCTGGLIGDWITNVPGSSDYYLGGVVAYSYAAKISLLGVPPGLLAQFGAVSEEAVREMARGAQRLLTGEYPISEVVALAVSGIAGPGGGMPDKPVGLVWIALCAPDFERAYRFIWGGNRLENKAQSAREALQLLLEYLEETPREEA